MFDVRSALPLGQGRIRPSCQGSKLPRKQACPPPDIPRRSCSLRSPILPPPQRGNRFPHHMSLPSFKKVLALDARPSQREESGRSMGREIIPEREGKKSKFRARNRAHGPSGSEHRLPAESGLQFRLEGAEKKGMLSRVFFQLILFGHGLVSII